MTPQSSFMVLARVARDKIADLRALLATMNTKPGVADPTNPLVAFGELETLHFARFVVLDDPTTGDVNAYGIDRPNPPVYLAFLGDFDGRYDHFLRELVARASRGLTRIYSLCEDFDPRVDLASWLRDHEHPPSTYYCNWVGRTVRQIREEDLLTRAVSEYIRHTPELSSLAATAVHSRVRQHVRDTRSGIVLTPPEPTPLTWSLRYALNVLTLVAASLIGILLLPILFVLWFKLRSLEKSDPEIAPRPQQQWAERLSEIEDYGVTNQFSAMGSLKPGFFRKYLLTLILWLVDLTTRVYYTRGRLARVHTIHFARWVYLDNKRRLLFASNYDGSLDSYMDDFINKVAFGLNAVFSNGIGYPKTESLVLQGAKNEQLFKYFIRRHELPTEVWYNAHAGLTTSDLDRNRRIREGVERVSLSAREAREWVALL